MTAGNAHHLYYLVGHGSITITHGSRPERYCRVGKLVIFIITIVDKGLKMSGRGQAECKLDMLIA